MPEKEYADFSDLQNQELPDENPPEQQNMPFQYLEESEEDKPQESEEDLSHLQNEDGSIKSEATDEQMQKLGVDNPKSYRYFQSEKDKIAKKYNEDLGQIQNQFKETIESLKGEIASMREQSTPKQEQPLTAPQRPSSDDPMDQMKYMNDMIEYQNKVIEKQGQMINGVNETFAQQQAQQQRNAVVTAFTKAGSTPQRANDIITKLTELQSSNPDGYAKFIVDAANAFLFDNPNPPQRKTQTGQVQPLAGVPSESESPKRDEAEVFFGDMNNFIKRHY